MNADKDKENMGFGVNNLCSQPKKRSTIAHSFHFSFFRQTGQSRSSKVKPLPNSDAVLNCPACFNVLCLDCQRHDVYETQYRAMFVTNCSVDTTQRLKYPKAKAGSKKKAKKTLEEVTDPPDEFHPVKCDHCSTEVAMYDKDEIYHFFNVMASHS